MNQYDLTVRHIAFQSRWFLNAPRYALLNNTNNHEVYGTKRRSAVELVEDSLNQQLPTVRDVDPADRDRLIVNLPETAAAREKQEAIQKAFTEWAWHDPKRSAMLAQIYNAKFNGRVTRQYDGSHLTLPGASKSIQLRATQKSAIWRILQSPTTLLAHAVGGGKSFVMIAAAMELKRLKLARKPLFAVPNHLVDQFAKEFIRLYPNATILVVGRDEVGKDRNVLMAKIATGNWDGVIVSHSSFNRLPVRRETELAFETAELDEIEAALRAEQTGANDRRIVKTLERAKRKFEARMAKAAALKSAFTLAFKLSQEANAEPPLLDTPDRIAALLREELRLQTVETLIVVLLNTRRKLIKYVRVADGTLDTILVHPREVFRPAIAANAAAIVLVHCHQSGGDPTPSEADIKVTRDLIRAGQLMKIELLDHVIIGRQTTERPKDYASLRELGYFAV